MKYFDGCRIAVTGACGTVGSELIKQLLSRADCTPSEVIGIDNNETALFFLEQEYFSEARANFQLTDISDAIALDRLFNGVDIVFHTAALKHVVLCERSPGQSVNTNIVGLQNVISAALKNKVAKTIFTSSDKAVNPTSVMGTSKLMGERLMTAANNSHGLDGSIFTSTRFGNVLGSNGSVIPIFANQIAKGGPVTLTDVDMTRFVMSLEESVHLVIDSALIARGGEVLITKMPVIRIEDLAAVMIEELAPQFGRDPADYEINIIGSKPGEKLYEELMSDEEVRRTVELANYFSVMPAFRGIYRDISYDYDDVISTTVNNPYISKNESSLSVEELRQFLVDNKLLENITGGVASRYWPEKKKGS